MQAIVFGGTGFIGSHVVEQLLLAGNTVTVIVRSTSNLAFLSTLDVRIEVMHVFEPSQLVPIMKRHDVVYNCTGNVNMHTKIENQRLVDVELTRILIYCAVLAGAKRFIQLSTIMVYGFDKNTVSYNELSKTDPTYTFQKVAIEREETVLQIGAKTGMETVILRPASTIGVRDTASFIATLYKAHRNNKFPLIGNGTAKVSFIDTRDIGRAMVMLGEISKTDQSIFLAKGYDSTWLELKMRWTIN